MLEAIISMLRNISGSNQDALRDAAREVTSSD